ncbi:hypothetical protein [Roseateles sp.]|uniref:hypothetical protein n=1 Tax=Roseateles sp. TaxID=1971397 RepID=UPI002DFE3371|nr:hypothetical protein [Roseateles sp.]
MNTPSLSTATPSSAPAADGWRGLPWTALALSSAGIGVLLLFRQWDVAAQDGWLGLVGWPIWLLLACCAGLWLVLSVTLSVSMPQALLDGPSVTAPWRGSVVALAGLALGALFVWVGVSDAAPVYAAFGLFVVIVLAGVRAVLVRINVRHGLFVATHDLLEIGMWAAWAALPWLAWEASGRAFDGRWAGRLAGVNAALVLVALAVAHMPVVLQPRMRLLVLVLALALAVAALARLAPVRSWDFAAPALRLSQPSNVALTETGCNAANIALDRRLCVYDPLARHGTLRNVRIESMSGDEVILLVNPTARPGCLTTQDLRGPGWRRVTLRKQGLLAWGQDMPVPAERACTVASS